MMRKGASLALAFGLLASSGAWGEQYRLDPERTSVQFRIKNLGLFSITGQFAKVSGDIAFSAEQPEETIANVMIDTASVETGKPSRDEELRGADFFASGEFPVLVFRSHTFHKTGDNTARLSGDVTLRGITRPVDFDVILGSPDLPPSHPGEAPHPRIAFSAEGILIRSQFGMTRYLPFLSDNVTLHITAEAVNSPEPLIKPINTPK